MDMNLMKNTLKDIKVPEGMHERLMQNCQKAKKSKPSYAVMYRAVAAVLVVAILVTSVTLWNPWKGNTVYGKDLMANVEANRVETTELQPEWIQAVADFSIELFKSGQTVDENSLISPLSVYLTLAMTANGADGETLTAFEQVLGNGISTDDINLYVYSLLQRLCKEEQDTLKINNSLWFDENRVGSVYKTFLQKNADYYGADAFQVDFGNEKDALNKVNNWAFQAIDGEVEKILKQVNPDTAMLLINTILFESDWAERYHHKTTAPFQNANKEWVTVKMLKEEKKYIENENATGFISEYKDEQYSFVALLPNEGMTLEEYVSGLTGEEFLEIVDVNTEKKCLSYLPEFTYAYKMDLAGALKNMGMEPAFGSNSDFSNLAKNGKQPGQIYLSQVEQQAFIQLDEEGTKAGAITVETLSTLGGEPGGGHYVFLNRPFLYAIIDNETELPIFLGTVNQLEGENTVVQAYSTYVEEKDGVTYRVVNSTEQFTSVIKGPEDTTCVNFDCFDGPLYKITYIEPYAYADNKNLEEVNFLVMDYANGLTIGEGAFANCPNLKKVFFSTDMGIFDTTIEKGAFAGSEQVVLYMPDFVDSEGSEAQVYLDAVEQGIPVILYNPSEVQ